MTSNYVCYYIARLNLKIICEELSEVKHKYCEIGVQLGIPYDKLHEFKNPFMDLLHYWLNGNVEGVPVCWSSVVEALCSNHVGERGLPV